MPTIYFQGQAHVCEQGENVLDCLNRAGASIPFSCHAGACQTCLMRATTGMPPAKAQVGLKDTLRAQHYFLPCICEPESNMEVALPAEDVVTHRNAILVRRERLNQDIYRLVLQTSQNFSYSAGQFVQVARADGLARSYSLAGLPNSENEIELHVQRLQGGQMSGWLCEEMEIGATLEIAGPSGNCFYTPGRPDQSLLLLGTGSGLAPLWGIVQDALRQGHSGPIYLFHGSWTPNGLYLVEELQEWMTRYANFVYVPCVDEEAHDGHRQGRADHIAFAHHPKLKAWRVFLCGHPGMVTSARKRAFLAGASLSDIYADPFCEARVPANK